MERDLEFFLYALAQTPKLQQHLEERIAKIRNQRKFLLLFLVAVLIGFLYLGVIPEMIYVLSALLILLVGLWIYLLLEIGDLGWRVYLSGVIMGVFKKNDILLATAVTGRLIGFSQKTVIVAMRLVPTPKIKRE